MSRLIGLWPLAALVLLVGYGLRYGIGNAMTIVLVLGTFLIGLMVLTHTPGKPLFFVPQLLSVLAMGMGCFAFVFPGIAWTLWEWPLGRGARVYIAPDGHIVAKHPANRIQVYDRDGKYRSGWFVATGERNFSHVTALSPDSVEVTTSNQEGSVLARTYQTIHRRRTYDFDGVPKSEETISRDEYEQAIREEPAVASLPFKAPWHLWLFASPPNGWSFGGFGFALMILIQVSGRICRPQLFKEADEKANEPKSQETPWK